MKRLPFIYSLFSSLVLCLSLAFWTKNLLTAPKRNASVVAAQKQDDPVSGQWGNLFGSSQAAQDSASIYQLKGVVVTQSAQDSAAIISINGKPAQSLHVGQEFTAGVTLSEVHQTHIVIKEAGVEKRIDLAHSTSPQLLTHAEISQGRASRPKSVEERSHRVAIAIPEITLAEEPLRPGRAVQQSNPSELPTASYLPPKMQ
jgi:type II secretory pathway component PulC